jgi:hypothetical protein
VFAARQNAKSENLKMPQNGLRYMYTRRRGACAIRALTGINRSAGAADSQRSKQANSPVTAANA